MPPKGPERRTAAAPVRRPMVGAAAAKAQAAEKTTGAPSAKAPPGARPKPAAGGPKKAATTIKKGPLKGLTSKKKDDAPADEVGGGGGTAAAEKPKAQARKPTSELDEEDSRGVRRSHDEYMSSAAQRMASLGASLMKKAGGGKTGLEDYQMDEEATTEAAEGGAMSMLDLLASLESDGGKTDLGIFASSVLQYSKDMGIRLSPEAIAAADPDDNHGVLLKCETRGLVFEDDSGTFVADDVDIALRLPYQDLKVILWDHQHSSVKLRTRVNEFVILAVENSLELEQELTKRFAEAIDAQALAVNMVPAYSYLGMFAGPTKPKPFERKRANLTQLKQSKMPALTKMREIAVERHNGPERPMPMEFSRRTLIALDHIHEGQCMFPVFTASGPEILFCANAVLVIDDEGLVFENDTLNENTSEDRRTVVLFENVSAWGIYDLGEDVVDNGIQLECKDGHYFFSVDDINNFRVCFEYFWNIHRTTVLKLSAQPGTTHGRKVVGIHTLMGEVKAPAVPTGNYQVIDNDGKVVKANAPPKRKKSFIERAAQEVFGSGKNIPTAQRGTVRPHWGKVVQHNGWLLKQGGMMKTWIKRYFVLYKTSQGHFLSYYSQYWESPLYNPERKERNMIDICKVTFLRARSKNKDAPPFSFDIATIEREWTLCADSNEDLQLWLQLIAAAVDEDVAIVPDDTLSFYVKARIDPSRRLDPNDYTSILQVSTWGVSVQKVMPMGTRTEIQFWCYTDFYKWYVMKQNYKTALSVQIFSEGNFKKKLEWVFRTPDAEKISTAIEYFIEKFMSRMHLRRELEEAMAPPPPPMAPPPEAENVPGSTKAATPRAAGGGPALPEPPPAAVGSGDSGNYEVGVAPKAAPEKTSEGKDKYEESEYGGDLIALFEEEDAVAASNFGMATGAEMGGSSLAGLGDTEAQNSSEGAGDGGTEWASDEEGDEDDMLYATYDVGMDSVDVDDPETLEKAFSPATQFFSPKWNPESTEDDATGKEGEGLDDAAAAAMKTNFKSLMTGIQGTLVKTAHLDLYYRHEFRGSQARLTLMYKNVSTSGALESLDAALIKASPNVRGHLPKHGDTIAPGTSQTQLLVTELMSPYAAPPELILSFTCGGDPYKYVVPLPVQLTHFLAPVILATKHFATRWDAMGEANEATASGTTKCSMDPASFNSVQGKLRTTKFGLGEDALDEGGAGLNCAAVMHTKSRNKAGDRVLMGVMAKVLVNGKSVTATVRTPTPAAAALIAAVIIAQME